jgi:hypothetical protein
MWAYPGEFKDAKAAGQVSVGSLCQPAGAGAPAGRTCAPIAVIGYRCDWLSL